MQHIDYNGNVYKYYVGTSCDYHNYVSSSYKENENVFGISYNFNSTDYVPVKGWKQVRRELIENIENGFKKMKKDF